MQQLLLGVLCTLGVLVVCALRPNIPGSELQALQEFYDSTNGTNWRWYTDDPEHTGVPWNFSVPNPNPCTQQWQGVNCSCSSTNCNVVGLELKRHNVSGQIPSSFSNLTQLEGIDLGTNQLSGTLPDSMRTQVLLEHISLEHNRINTIPEWLPDLQALWYLSLESNNITGPLPPYLFQMSNMTVLWLGNNQITGTLPAAVSNLTSLEDLKLEFNGLNGTIPTALCTMKKLQQFHLSSNKFTGQIPTCICDMPALMTAEVALNLLHGYLPADLGKLQRLVNFDASSNMLSGPIPESLNNSLVLVSLNLGNNLFATSLPYSLGTNQQLLTLVLEHNLFYGSMPNNLVTLLEISFGSNLFVGSITDITVSEDMHYFRVPHNLFTGSLPGGVYKTLIDFDASDNFFSGTLPASYDFLATTNYFHVDKNLLSGTISDFFSLPLMNIVSLSDNCFTGAIPAVSLPSQQLKELILRNNRFTGPIPASLGTLTGLAEIDFRSNRLSGTLPEQIGQLSDLAILFIADNQLTGPLAPLVNASAQLYLKNVDVSHNLFTGELPPELFHLPSLTSLAATSNCFHGSLPMDICASTNMSSLVLDGLSTACRVDLPLSRVSTYLNTFVLRESVHGTIPPCVFYLPHLRTLHLSGNGLTGKLPENLTLSAVMSDLVVSHNRLSGAIPRNLQMHVMRELDLSYNRFGGTLSKNFVGVEKNGTLKLEVNRLSGDIPIYVQALGGVNVLNGNIFFCDASRSQLPPSDPKASIYDCGSNAVDYSVYTWCSALVALVVTVAVAVVVKCRELSTREQWKGLRQSVTDSSQALTLTAAEWHLQTNPGSNKTCQEEDEMEARDERRLSWPFPHGGALRRLASWFAFVRRLVATLTAIIALVLMPAYVGLSNFTNTYELEYGWQISGILLAGTLATVLLVVAGGLLFGLLYALILRQARLWRQESAAVPKRRSADEADLDTSRLSQADEVNRARRRKAWVDRAQLSVLSLGNAVVMVAIDCAYVYILLNYDSTVVTMAQVCLALFKIAWNDRVLWVVVPWTKVNWFNKVRMRVRRRRRNVEQLLARSSLFVQTRFSSAMPPAASGLGQVHDASLNSTIEEAGTAERSEVAATAGRDSDLESVLTVHTLENATKSVYSADDVKFICSTILLNNIVVPAVAIACVSSLCFNDALLTPPAVTDTYVIAECAIYISSNPLEACAATVPVEQQTTYDPPFDYSYQCASNIIINYAAVFVFMFAASGLLVPALKLAARHWLLRLPDSHPHKLLLVRLLPASLRPPVPQVVGPAPVLLAKEKMVVRMVNFLAIVVAFGSVYPPIAVIGTVAVFSVTTTEEFILGSLLMAADRAGLRWYREELSRQSAQIEELFRECARQVYLFSFLVLCYLAFDTYGYSYGWRSAMAVVPAYFVGPLLMVGAYRLWIDRQAAFSVPLQLAASVSSLSFSRSFAMSASTWSGRVTSSEMVSPVESAAADRKIDENDRDRLASSASDIFPLDSGATNPMIKMVAMGGTSRQPSRMEEHAMESQEVGSVDQSQQLRFGGDSVGPRTHSADRATDGARDTSVNEEV